MDLDLPQLQDPQLAAPSVFVAVPCMSHVPAPFAIDALGHGMLLVKTDVYRRLDKPWYQCLLDPNCSEINGGGYIGEDVYFCDRAKAAGYRIWCDPVMSRWCAHVGMQSFTLNPTGFGVVAAADFMARQAAVTFDEAKTLSPALVRDNRL